MIHNALFLERVDNWVALAGLLTYPRLGSLPEKMLLLGRDARPCVSTQPGYFPVAFYVAQPLQRIYSSGSAQDLHLIPSSSDKLMRLSETNARRKYKKRDVARNVPTIFIGLKLSLNWNLG
jgi:hypothetical protein